MDFFVPLFKESGAMLDDKTPELTLERSGRADTVTFGPLEIEIQFGLCGGKYVNADLPFPSLSYVEMGRPVVVRKENQLKTGK